MERVRCRWCGADPLLCAYHDEEWGGPLQTDAEYFERLSLEVFQAGLSWRTVLHKREAFRRAFEWFEPSTVASYGEDEVDRLMNDPAIVRNQRKIRATIHNAKVVLDLATAYGSFEQFLQSLTSLSEPEVIREFKRRFEFMGPEIVRSFLQSVGRLPIQHDPECFMA